jgi:hypothetical protein
MAYCKTGKSLVPGSSEWWMYDPVGKNGMLVCHHSVRASVIFLLPGTGLDQTRLKSCITVSHTRQPDTCRSGSVDNTLAIAILLDNHKSI